MVGSVRVVKGPYGQVHIYNPTYFCRSQDKKGPEALNPKSYFRYLYDYNSIFKVKQGHGPCLTPTDLLIYLRMKFHPPIMGPSLEGCHSQ